MTRTAALVCLAMLVACGTTQTSEPPDEVAQLRWLDGADPLIDAKRAVERNDFTLLAVNGYTWTIPGVAETDKFACSEKYGMKAIKGTSDVIMGTEHRRLIELAMRYAKTYNEYVLAHAR